MMSFQGNVVLTRKNLIDMKLTFSLELPIYWLIDWSISQDIEEIAEMIMANIAEWWFRKFVG